MAEPTARTIKKLFALSGNLCAFPECRSPIIGNDGTVTGEICHIKARRPRGPRFDATLSSQEREDFANLLLLCSPHHKVIDSEPVLYTVAFLKGIKDAHQRVRGRAERDLDELFARLLLNKLSRPEIANTQSNVAINSPGTIQALTVNVKGGRRAVSVNAPPGTIGSDHQKSRYIQHLIARYNKFASADKTRNEKFRYGAISGTIERRFRATWKLLPAERFEALCQYLGDRINKTIVGKTNARNGRRSFSTYLEYLSEENAEPPTKY